MLLSDKELELLKLCGIGRFMPCNIAGKYDLPELRTALIRAFVDKGYLKIVNGEYKCYRLSRRGRDLLFRAGYRYPDDIRPRREGEILKRRVIHSEINVLLHGAGIDVYTEAVEGLQGAAYIPSLTIRADKQSRSLAGTKFYGIIRMRDTAYVIYYADDERDGILPQFEEQTFSNLVSSISGIKHIIIAIVCRSVEGFKKIIFPDYIYKLKGGYVTLSELIKKWKYEFCFVPMSRDGMLQMQIEAVKGMRGQIAQKFGDTSVPSKLSCFDAVSEGKAYMLATDMNITKVIKGLEQTIYADVIPSIICLPYQKAIYQELAVRNQYPKLMKFTALNRSKLIEQFPQLGRQEEKPKPAKTVDGEYIEES